MKPGLEGVSLDGAAGGAPAGALSATGNASGAAPGPAPGTAPLSTARAWWRGIWVPRHDAARRRVAAALRREELSGLAFAYRARLWASAAVALWLVVIVPAPRSFYYLAVVGLFYLLGLVPHLLRRHPRALAIKLAFILLDVSLITAVIIVPAPFTELGWPIQMRLRWHDYLYLLLFLVGSAISYSPLTVAWTGLCVIAVWSAGFLAVYLRPDTLTFAEATGGLQPVPPEVSMRVVLDPHFVGISQLLNQAVLTAILTGLLAAAVWRARRTMVRQARAEVTRADLARYVSPDVADALIASPDQVLGAPHERRVAVLFADIVGFTAQAEHLPPERVVALLKSFHARGCRIVFDHGGTLDKYLGDGFMATFGTLRDDPDAAAQAVACAFAIVEECRRWGVKRMARGAPALEVAIGVHVGPVVVGNVGADRRLEFTVVGDTVNVASRLERLTRDHACTIALSRDAIEAAGRTDLLATLEPRGALPIRGREAPLEVYLWRADRAAGHTPQPAATV